MKNMDFFRWQNLLEDDNPPYRKPFPWHGRCWISFFSKRLRIEWNAKSKHCHISYEREPLEGEYTISLAFPPCAIWISFCGYHSEKPHRDISLRVHDGIFWWTLWRDPHNGRVSDWREGCFHYRREEK